jgi:hypothetical protein
VDFIERYLGISPDRGDGSFEVMLLVIAALLIMIVAMMLRFAVK